MRRCSIYMRFLGDMFVQEKVDPQDSNNHVMNIQDLVE